MERTDSWQLSKRSCYLKHVASLNCTRPHIRYGKKVDRVPKVYLKPGGCRVLFPFFCVPSPPPPSGSCFVVVVAYCLWSSSSSTLALPRQWVWGCKISQQSSLKTSVYGVGTSRIQLGKEIAKELDDGRRSIKLG